MSGADVAIVASALGVLAVIVGALWRVGSVGRTLGETLTRIESRLTGAEARLTALEQAESRRTQDLIADQRRQIEALQRQVDAHQDQAPRPARPSPPKG